MNERNITWSKINGPIEGAIALYEAGWEIESILSEVKLHYFVKTVLWETKDVRNYLKIYKRLKASGQYRVPADVELYEEDEVVPVRANLTRTEDDVAEESEENSDSVLDEDDYEEEKVRAKVSKKTCKKPQKPKPSMPEKDIVSDPSKSFQAMKKAVTVIAKKVGKALVISGNGGVGKTYAVNSVLEAYGLRRPADYNILKTKCTPVSMYKFLYRNQDKICIFDDCDSILQNAEGRSILKSALDSDNIREVFWNSDGKDMVDTTSCEDNDEVAAVLEKWSKRHEGRQGIPNHFFFNGSVIIISNMKKNEIKTLDEALVTRCHTVEVLLSNEEILDRLGGLLANFKIYDANNQDITDEDMKTEVFDWISSDEYLSDERMQGKTLNFRLFVNTYKALYANGDGSDDWKQVAFQG